MKKAELERILSWSDRSLQRGWRLAGPGPARFGWWGVTAAGDARYLGRTLANAAARVGAK